MAKTSIDARKHVKEWSRFFAAAGAVGEAAVKEFINHCKRKKYLRQSLVRLMEKGFVTKRGSEFAPTKVGRRFFMKHGSAPALNRKLWDGKWRLVIFDVPVGYNNKRDQLRGLVKEFGFFLLQKSVWVCPNYLTEDFWQEVTKNKLDKYCRVMVVEFIEEDQDLRKRFNLPVR